MALTEAQKKERLQGIGGSDCAVACGFSRWKTALELWAEKIGLLSDDIPENDPMYWGNRLEPLVRDEYSFVTGREVIVPDKALVHGKYPFMRANLDGIATDDRVFEAKTARRPDGWGEPGSDEVPDEYLLQVQHYMMVTGYAVADIAVLIGGSDFRIYEIPADRELQENIVDLEATFWQHVVDRTEPIMVDSHPAALQAVKRLYPGTDGKTVYADARLDHYRGVYEDAKARANDAGKLADLAKAQLLVAMKSASALRFEDGMELRRKTVRRKGYEVAPNEFVEARFVKSRKPEGND